MTSEVSRFARASAILSERVIGLVEVVIVEVMGGTVALRSDPWVVVGVLYSFVMSVTSTLPTA